MKLVKGTSEELASIIRRSDIKSLLWEMVKGEDGSRGPDDPELRKRFERIVDGRVTAEGWSCFWYSFYLHILKPIYGFAELGAVQNQHGDVLSIDNKGEYATDGDFTFLLGIDPPQSYKGTTYKTLHCEITPCNQPSLKAFIDELKAGRLPRRVSLDGTLSFDPAHTGDEDTDKLEIHPVTAARFL
jgi:hypothetical protein